MVTYGRRTAWFALGRVKVGRPSRPPTHRGFGTSIMENIIAGQLRGEVHFDWRNHGLACEITLLIA